MTDTAKRTFIGVLRQFGFTKTPWEKCAKHFKEANYRCYSHPDKNIYAEVYLSDPWPYMWIVGEGIEDKIGMPIRGQLIYDPQILFTVLNQTNSKRIIKQN